MLTGPFSHSVSGFDGKLILVDVAEKTAESTQLKKSGVEKLSASS